MSLVLKHLWFITFSIILSSGVYAFQQQDTLKIGVYESPPFVIYKNTDQIEGISGWLWNQIKQELEQPYKIVRYTSNAPLTSIISDLDEGIIDMSINPITITSSRDEKLIFSYPFFIGDLSIAKKETSNIDSVIQILQAMFNNRVLVLIGLLIVLIVFFGLIIWLIEKNNKHFERNFQGVLTSLWWSVVTMTTVGYGDKVPISNKGRLVAVIWMVCSLITISIFTASLTSTLTVRQLANIEYSLSDFKQNKVGTVAESATQDFLERNFFRDIQTYPEFTLGLNALNQEEIDVFVYDRSWLLYQLNNNPKFSSLELLPIRFKMQHYSMPMRKDLDLDIQRTISSNIIKSLETKDWELLLNEYDLNQD